MSERRRHRAHGGKGGAEPPARVRARELRAHELAVLGWSQHQIAAELGVSQAAVSKMLKRVDRRVLAELTDAAEQHKVRQTLRLEHLYAESMRAWRESQEDSERRRQRKTEPGANGGGAATVAELVTENRHGDPRYLEEARKALADHRKIWGLDAPQKLDLRATRHPYADLSEEELHAELARLNQLVKAPEQAEPSAEAELCPNEPSGGTDVSDPTE